MKESYWDIFIDVDNRTINYMNEANTALNFSFLQTNDFNFYFFIK